ncbi:Crp/Fnr family transcriptional regulator [Mucilaginibacter sp. OK098]|uniref:Crp/Fnr family transcriptional regulator n=1 Tax=Mucilaginibacter sp. OK098 TaxID=1855297 RepID=UPI000921FC84|nr:Crp/Fnr family transcriptional regulator [Mucilaginibacter sp. OK098]SHN01130.1 cAMP-binding domain of CRP or a regulatory subunit of cAMP-dependent protein kinases [Mucilaginibacter sp. OK098]
MANVKLLEYLSPLIPDSAESVSLLVSHFEHKVLQKGDIVLKEGEICTAFYFVESGHLRTCYNKEGVKINMHFHLEGSITSDHINGKAGIPSEFTIEAGEKSEIWVLNRETLVELCHADPKIMIFGRRLLSRILVDLSAHSNLFRMYTPAERYQYIEKNSPHLLQRVSLSNLASYLGMNRRTLTRIRAKK